MPLSEEGKTVNKVARDHDPVLRNEYHRISGRVPASEKE
jgi:hypothetical protein